MTLALGLAVVLFAGILQGTFILPMNHTRDWKWEHNWFVFSLLGMFVLNAVIGFATIPALFSIYAATPQSTVNGAYCLWQMQRKAQLSNLFHNATLRNAALIFAMAAMWIGSFYIYGLGTSLLGSTGAILAWPLFICTSILIGNFWGLRAGEWTSSTPAARNTLRAGMAILLLSVIVIALVNLGQG